MNRLIVILIIAASTVAGVRATDSDSQMSQAIMQVYADMLAENPKDYDVYFRRANEYYRRDEYLRALDDINNAIAYTPASETDLRFQEHMLRAGIYEMSHRFRLALDDLNRAVDLDPNSYQAIYQRANAEFELGMYAEAKADYTRMQRLNSRSQEALFGLARVAVKENNLGLANEYVEQAVALTPSQSEAYVRRASVKALMSDYNGAVDDLILALSTDASDSKALTELVKLANSNYAAVMNGLTSAIRQAPRVGMFYYLRATISAAHFHYNTAISDFDHIIKNGLYNYSGIYASLAECYYALGNYETALDNIDNAIANFNDEGDNARYYTIRARICRATGDYEAATAAIGRALEINGEYTDALIEKALLLTDRKQADQSIALLGHASMNEPDNPYIYMLRAWVLNDYLNQPKGALGFYNRIIDLDTADSDSVRSLYGFALLFAGKTAQAVAWMDECLSRPDYDGQTNYYGACFYAWAGKPDKALLCMEQALRNGYANYHQWTACNDARINVAPLRDMPRFRKLMSQYAGIFLK